MGEKGQNLDMFQKKVASPASEHQIYGGAYPFFQQQSIFSWLKKDFQNLPIVQGVPYGLEDFLKRNFSHHFYGGKCEHFDIWNKKIFFTFSKRALL